ncbi:hypothetical protein D0861_01080 [Hortaea werneckii]|uniref:SWIM-type domain-containing protein n=1 Tax=Hortaea werneckii TaxID=91943 RepID=A0A3M7G1Q8_HORWE|nr:hypothetical protein D0861_01080 [Hortaea werneckii]
MTNIPTPRQLTTKLVDSLPRSPDPGIGNPLHNAPESKDYLLSLHVLFPNELLPALDLLDRGLVTRMYVQSEEHASQPNATQSPNEVTARTPVQSGPQCLEATDGHGHAKDDHTGSHNTCKGSGTYQVRSAQQSSSRGGSSRYRNAAYEHTSYYEGSQTDEGEFATQRASHAGRSGWVFGGLTLGQGMPVCKHLLACVLVEYSGTFSHCVYERSLSKEEMAGWAAGWGD